MNHLKSCVSGIAVVAMAVMAPPCQGQGQISGESKVWHRVTITFDGPQTSETAEPNPFLDYRLNVTFRGPGGCVYEVPGFYAADGRAAESGATAGDKWQVHFTPDRDGTWRYTASFRKGPRVSIDLAPDAGASAGYCDGASGTFKVGPTDKTGIDLRGKGMLRYIGEHYLQFAGTGEYYLKGGADSPENFLGYTGFDGTYDIGGTDTTGQKKQVVGLRFQDVDVPRGAEIEGAYVQFACDEPGKNHDPFGVRIWGQASDNAGVFTTTSGDLSSRPRTSASVVWEDIPAWEVEHEAGKDQRTPNLAPIVQEIVGRNDWQRGNALAVFFVGSGIRTAESFEGDPDLAAELVIEFDGGRLSRRIAEKDDDMEQYVAGGIIDRGSTDIELVFEESGEDPRWAFGLHKYTPHVGDWRTGDPCWQGGKGKGIIGAINYLADQGGNSIYFLTYNIDNGDGQDTWIWTSHDERERIDVSKMDQWELVFSHMTARGMQLHVVLSEAENHGKMGRGFSDIRKLYYRELVARFAHHPALLWNLGEENGNSDEQRKAFAAYLHALDPYDHPVTVHTYFDKADTFYDGVLGDPHFEATSIQGRGSRYNEWAIELRRRSMAGGRPWAIYGDEQGPAVARDMGNLTTLRKGTLWGNLMGGGAGVEWYFGYQGNFGDCTSEDWRPAEPLWETTRIALDFFQQYLPFWEMEPDNALTSAENDYCLVLPGQLYAIYLPEGGSTSLLLPAGTYGISWYNPRRGGELLAGSVRRVMGPGSVSVGEPPEVPNLDWAVLVRKRD